MEPTNAALLDAARAQSFSRLPSISADAAPAQIRQKAKEFEAVFAQQMLEPMFENLGTDGMFGGGHAEGIYRSFLVQEIAEEIAEGGGFGIAEAVTREMLSIQEANNGF